MDFLLITGKLLFLGDFRNDLSIIVNLTWEMMVVLITSKRFRGWKRMRGVVVMVVVVGVVVAGWVWDRVISLGVIWDGVGMGLMSVASVGVWCVRFCCSVWNMGECVWWW